jgi:hypothetical protein
MDYMPYIWCYKFGVVRNNIQRWGIVSNSGILSNGGTIILLHGDVLF